MQHPQKGKIRITKIIDQLGNIPNDARQTDRKNPGRHHNLRFFVVVMTM